MTRARRWVLWLARLAACLLLAGSASATEQREIVMVLDTSGSMAGRYGPGGGIATDPDRLSLLGTQMIVSLLAGSPDDEVTVFGFPEQLGAPARRLTADMLPGLEFNGGTPYLTALSAALEVLKQHPERRKVLIFLTDGQPDQDETLPMVKNAIAPFMAIGTHPAIIGLVPNGLGLQAIEPYLDALAGGDHSSVAVVTQQSEIVGQLTRALAHAFDSEPDPGVLKSGRDTMGFDIGAGVKEVLIALAAQAPGQTFQGQLEVQGGGKQVGAGDWRSGYNDVNPSRGRYWQTLRYLNTSGQNLHFTLRTLDAQGEVQYGIIYKYDLLVQLDTVSAVEGKDTALTAHVRSGTQSLDKKQIEDAGFGSTPVFSVNGAPLAQCTIGPDGTLGCTWHAARPANGDRVTVRVALNGPHGALTGQGVVVLRKPTELSLKLPPSIDLGSFRPEAVWWGRPPAEPHCAVLDLGSSPGAEAIPLACSTENWPGDANPGVACTPDPNSRAAGVGEFLRWNVCLDPKPCCGPMQSAASGTTARVILAGRDGDYRQTRAPVSVYFNVARPDWLRCYWPWLAAALGLAFTIWVVRGILSPFSFEPQTAFSIASSEAGLRKNQANVAVEAPGGRRGFYRHARVAVNASGDLVRDPRAAVVVIQAARGASTRVVRAAGLEKKDSRTGKWNPVPEKEFDAGLLAKAIYRVGQLYIKWE